MSLSLELPFPYRVLVYKKGSDIVARTRDGRIISTSTTDASVVINAAITAQAAFTEGGSIFIYAGVYPCLTEIVMTDTAANNQGVSLIGESKDECKLNFVPTGSLTNAIRFKMHHAQMRGIHLAADADVINLIRIDGNGQHGIIDSCQFTGATVPPTATGQIGILNDATTAAATYYWRFTNNQFNSLDTCGKFTAGTNPSNANFFNNNNFINFNTGLHLLSNMHMISNQFFQGEVTMGAACIKLDGSGCFNCGLLNIKADSLSLAGSAVVELTSGATNNHGAAITNTGTGALVEDASGLLTNFFLPASEDKANTFTKKQTIQITTGEAIDLYRATSTVGHSVDVSFYHMNASSVKKRLGAFSSELLDATAGSEDTAFNIWVQENGAFLRILKLQPTLITIPDATNIAVNATTGTKIGTATTQKIGFYNATPVVQGASIADVNAATVNTTFGQEEVDVITDLRTKVNSLISRLEALGLIATV